MASRLAELQRQRGHDAYVVSAISGSLRDAPLAQPGHTVAAVWDERVVRAPGFAAPISLARDGLNKKVASELRGADIIHIHWPNGLVALDTLAELAGTRPVVWTLHDMNAFTAVCHYSLGCTSFTSGCSTCPAVRGTFQLSATNHLTAKKASLNAFHDLRLVTPSIWLANEATKSEALSGYPVTTIPNPLDDDAHPRLTRTEARSKLGIDPTVKSVFALSASHLHDPLKAVHTATESFAEAFPGRDDVMLLVSGRGALAPQPQVRQMGYVTSEMSRTIFAAADYLVVPSLAENQPLVIAEAQAAGASLIARNTTGLPEHLDIDPTGLLFDSNESIAKTLREAASNPPSQAQRDALADRAREKFSADGAVSAYERVYGL